MKIFALAVLVAILLGGAVGTLLVRDPGYVLISYANTVLETSLWVALLLLIGVYLLFWGLFFFTRKLGQGQLELLRWRSGRKLRAARNQTVRGLLVMAEGRWAEARKLLADAAQNVETPLINYLNAARACHELGERDDRDAFLKLAHESTPGAKFAVTLTQAEFHIHEGEYEQALAALLVLRRRAPKHRAVLAMLADCHEALHDWEALKELLRDLARNKALPEAELRRLEQVVWQALLNGADTPAVLWKKMPKHLKNEPALLRGWVDALRDAERVDDAEHAARLALSQHWDSELALAYGEIHSSDPQRQLVVAQGWGKERPNDAALALTLGRLCLVNEKFEQARDYFEASLRLSPNDVVYGELGRLCVALGDEQRGTEYLLRSLGALADLPQPQEPSIRKASVS